MIMTSKLKLLDIVLMDCTLTAIKLNSIIKTWMGQVETLSVKWQICLLENAYELGHGVWPVWRA